MDKTTIKRYVFSSIVTFLAGFGVVLYGDIDNITMTSFQDGTVFGVLFLAARAGVKAVLEYFFVTSGDK